MHEDRSEGIGREIQASEIQAKILHGESIIYDSVIVMGDLGLPPRTSKTIVCPIAITNSVIRGTVDFNHAIFFNSVDFRRTTFSRTRFTGSKFDQPVEFEGAHFQEETHFNNVIFIELVNFKKTVFEKYIDFGNAVFSKGVEFSRQNRDESFNNRSIFKGHTQFKGTKFNGIAHFEACEFQDIEYGTIFRGAIFEKEAYFQNSVFKGSAFFLEVAFKHYTDFNSAVFSSSIKGVGFAEARFFGYFTDFRNVLFNGLSDFRATQFTGEFVSFRNAKFRNVSDQETVCRIAKNIFAKTGNREEEEYHFYQEMEAKRIRRGIRGDSGLGLSDCLKTDTWSFWNFFFYDVLEFFFVQKIFGYGIHPFWLFAWWLSFVGSFVIIYWIGGAVGIPGINGEIYQSSNLTDYIWFSIATAATPGYALYKPLGEFKILAGIEAIIGTFMWAAFITTFARKFSR